MVPALLKYERVRSPGAVDRAFPRAAGRSSGIVTPLVPTPMQRGVPTGMYGLTSGPEAFRRVRTGIQQESSSLRDLGEEARGGWKYYGKKLSTRGGKKPENPWRRAKPGGPWYGHHLGPYSEEDAEQEPVSPVDAAAKRHDEDYGKIQGRYGMYERYGANDGSSWGVGRVWVMNYFEPNVGLHAELGMADAALVARSWTGIAEGLWSGKYRLEYDQGWGMLLSDIVWALGITFVYAGPSALWHLYLTTNPAFLALSAAVSIADYYGISGGWKYYGGQISEGWKYHGGQVSEGWKHAGGQVSGGWKYYGGQVSEGWKHYGSVLSRGWKYYTNKFETGWDVDFNVRGGAQYYGRAISGGWKYYGGQVSEGWKYHGGQVSEGWKHAGGQVSGGWKYYGGQVSEGWKYHGGQLSSGWKHAGGVVSDTWKSAGGRFSDWAKGVGGGISQGAKSAGAKISDAWKSATGGGGGGGGGGCFLTTSCIDALGVVDGERILDVFRAFRDHDLIPDEQGAALVGAYYLDAPRIVAEIDISPERAEQYREIYREIVLPTYLYIEAGQPANAIAIYRRGVERLSARWLNPSATPGSP